MAIGEVPEALGEDGGVLCHVSGDTLVGVFTCFKVVVVGGVDGDQIGIGLLQKLSNFLC